MDAVRVGVIGLGNMGTLNARALQEGKLQRAVLGAVCDRNEERRAPFKEVARFASPPELISSGTVDAVYIATPHFDHLPTGIAALEQGLHVLVEKPLAAHKADAEQLLAAHTRENQVFAAMFNQRTDPRYAKLKALIDAGELGQIHRINWIVTDWFRTEAYYRSGGWRATWAGEGGGVLLNQSSHQLDLMSWLFGQPAAVRGFCQLGRFHEIEVEDSVTAYFEYGNGATGVFITTTGETPGTNRLEVAAERGRIIIEDAQLSWIRNEVPTTEFSRSCERGFAAPPTWKVTMDLPGSGSQHLGIVQNFIDAIVEGTPLLSPAREGIHGVELANAILYSHFNDRKVTLPLDSQAYAALLRDKIETSTYEKKTVSRKTPGTDFDQSF